MIRNFAGLLKVKVFFLVLVYIFEFWIFGHHFGEGSIINADSCFSNPDINSLTDTNSSRNKTARSQDPLYMFKWNKINDFLNKITLSHSCRTFPIRKWNDAIFKHCVSLSQDWRFDIVFNKLNLQFVMKAVQCSFINVSE